MCAIPQAALGEFTRSGFQTITKIIIGYVLSGSKLQTDFGNRENVTAVQIPYQSVKYD